MAQLHSLLYVGFIIVVVAGWIINRRKNTHNNVGDHQFELEELMPEDLQDALLHSHWKVRLQALELLLKDQTKGLLDTLLKMLSDPTINIRLVAMSEIVSYEDKAIAGLANILNENNLTARESAIQVLLVIGGPATIPVLANALLHDESAWIRVPAAEGLGNLGGQEASEALIAALKDSHPDVNEAVRQALEQIGTPEALDALAR